MPITMNGKNLPAFKMPAVIDDEYPEQGLVQLAEDIKSNWTQPTGINVEQNIGWNKSDDPNSIEGQSRALVNDESNYIKEGKVSRLKPDVQKEVNRLDEIIYGQHQIVSNETISLNTSDVNYTDGARDEDARGYFQTQTKVLNPEGEEPFGTWHSTTRKTDKDDGHTTDHNEVFQKLVVGQTSPGVTGDKDNPEHYIPQMNTVTVNPEEELADMPSYADGVIPDTKVRSVDGQDSRVNLYEAKLIDDFGSIGEKMTKDIGSGDVGPDGRKRYQQMASDFSFGNTFAAQAKMVQLKRVQKEKERRDKELETRKTVGDVSKMVGMGYKAGNAWDTYNKMKTDELMEGDYSGKFGPGDLDKYEKKGSQFFDLRKAENRIQETQAFKDWKGGGMEKHQGEVKKQAFLNKQDALNKKEGVGKYSDPDVPVVSDDIQQDIIHDTEGNVIGNLEDNPELMASENAIAGTPTYTSPTEGPVTSSYSGGENKHLTAIKAQIDDTAHKKEVFERYGADPNAPVADPNEFILPNTESLQNSSGLEAGDVAYSKGVHSEFSQALNEGGAFIDPKTGEVIKEPQRPNVPVVSEDEFFDDEILNEGEQLLKDAEATLDVNQPGYSDAKVNAAYGKLQEYNANKGDDDSWMTDPTWEESAIYRDQLDVQEVIEHEKGSTSGFYKTDRNINELDIKIQNDDIITPDTGDILPEMPIGDASTAGNLIGDMALEGGPLSNNPIMKMGKDSLVNAGLQVGTNLIANELGIEEEVGTVTDIYKGAKTVKDTMNVVSSGSGAVATVSSGGMVPGIGIATGAFQAITADEPEDQIAGATTALGSALMFTPAAPLGAVMVAGSTLWSLFG